MGWRGGAAQQPRRGTGRSGGAGLKKAEPGVWWAEWCCFFLFPFPSPQRRLVFSARTLRSVDADAMSADRVQGARLVFSSACIVCIIYSHCLAKAPAN